MVCITAASTAQLFPMPDKFLGVIEQFTPKYGKGRTSPNLCLAESTEHIVGELLDARSWGDLLLLSQGCTYYHDRYSTSSCCSGSMAAEEPLASCSSFGRRCPGGCCLLGQSVSGPAWRGAGLKERTFFTVREVGHWNKLLREFMDASSLEMFKVRLDNAFSSLI